MLSTTPNVIAARVLIVDDNPGTAETLARAISRISPSLSVTSATDAESALKQLRGEAVDLVITDMMMPGMSGLELIERLRQRSPGNRLYAILITAYDVPGLRESARRMKVNDILIKPFSPERICQIARHALERAAPAPSLDKRTAETTPKFKLLAADDNPSNLALLLRYLQQEEYQVLTASSGAETLETLRAELPDLLLLDVNMPEMDGFQVLEKMRSDPALEYIPVIIVTAARLDPVDMQYALNMGADDYVTKPFDRRELLARIRTRLRVKQAEDVLRRRSRQLDLLLAIGRELNIPRALPDLADSLLRRTVDTLDASAGYLIVQQPEKIFTRTYCKAAQLRNEHAAALPDGALLLSQLQQSHQGFMIGDARGMALPGDDSRSVLIAPISFGSNLLGAFILAHKQPGYFSHEHGSLLQAIANQSAMAVQNALLSAESKQG